MAAWSQFTTAILDKLSEKKGESVVYPINSTLLMVIIGYNPINGYYRL